MRTAAAALSAGERACAALDYAPPAEEALRERRSRNSISHFCGRNAPPSCSAAVVIDVMTAINTRKGCRVRVFDRAAAADAVAAVADRSATHQKRQNGARRRSGGSRADRL